MTGTLVVIDMQKVFGEPGSQWASGRYPDIVPLVGRLVAAFGDDTVFTRYVAPAEPTGAWVPYFEDWPFALQPPDADLWDVWPDTLAQSAAGRPVVTATTFSKWGPELAGLIRDNRMVLVGVSTDCCVLSTALAAADAGVEVWVVGEATAGLDAATEAKTLEIMALYGPLVKIVSLDEALAAA
jgi:nicotinamidase-related amidase